MLLLSHYFLTWHLVVPSGSNINKTLQSVKNQAPYRLRSKSESAATNSKNKNITPTKRDKSVVSSTKLNTPTSAAQVCGICRGIEDLRSIKLNEAVAEFMSQIEAYKEFTKSFHDNTSTLSHALDTIKHFIMHTKPKEINQFLSNTLDKLNTISDNIHDLSNYNVTKFDAIEEFIRKKVENASSSHDSYSRVIERLNSLESICGQLNSKIDAFNHSSLNSIPLLETQNIESGNNLTNTPPPVRNPNTCIILGDSNTKYVSLASNTLDSHRVPMFLIEDIDPYKCVGYKKIWIHVGTNNIKSINCKSNHDIKKHYDTLINKLNTIRNVCPHSNPFHS